MYTALFELGRLAQLFVNYVLYTYCCHRHWTLTLGSFYSLLFTAYCSLYQSSFLLIYQITIIIIIIIIIIHTRIVRHG